MKLLIAVLLLAFSTGAMAGWTYFDSPEDYTYDIYIDKTTIRKRGNVAKMWYLTDYKSPRKGADGRTHLSTKALMGHDCVEIRRRVLAITSFSGNLGKGEVVFSHQYGDGEWQDVVPDSIGMTEWKAVCKK